MASFNLRNLHIDDTINELFLNAGNTSQSSNFNIQDIVKSDSINTVMINPTSQPTGFSIQNTFSNDVINVSVVDGFNPDPTPPSNEFIMYTPTEFSTIGEDSLAIFVKEENQSDTQSSNLFALPSNNACFITETMIEKLITLEGSSDARFNIFLGEPNSNTRIEITNNVNPPNNGYIITDLNNSPTLSNTFFTGNNVNNKNIYIYNQGGNGITQGSLKLTMTHAAPELYSPTNFTSELTSAESLVALVKNEVQANSPTANWILNQSAVDITTVIIENITPITYTGDLPSFELLIGDPNQETLQITILTLANLNNGVTKTTTFYENFNYNDFKIFIKLVSNSAITGGAFKVTIN